MNSGYKCNYYNLVTQHALQMQGAIFISMNPQCLLQRAHLPILLTSTQKPVRERPQFGSQEQSLSPRKLHAREASSSRRQQDLGASLGPRANYPTSSKVWRGLRNLQGGYRR